MLSGVALNNTQKVPEGQARMCLGANSGPRDGVKLEWFTPTLSLQKQRENEEATKNITKDFQTTQASEGNTGGTRSQ